MKRHANKHTKIFGLLTLSLLAGLSLFAVAPTWAEETKTQEVDVEFTFNSVINLTVDEESMKIEGMSSGMAQDSNEITLTVDTNSSNGYYVAATTGKPETDTNLTSENGTIAHLSDEDNMATLSEMKDNTWGIACVKGDAELTNAHYSGFPLDQDDKGETTGKHILDEEGWDSVKTAKCKVGVKTAPTLPAGTYTNVVNFYAIAK